MEHHHDDDTRSAFVIAYMFIASSGAFVGFLAGLFVGKMIWG